VTTSAPNVHEYTVGELSFALKRSVEDTFGHVRVRGEISGLKRAASGHVYMTLKDEDAVLDGVCWRGVAGRLRFQPEDGLEVVCMGKLTTYPGRSKYQIVIESMEPAGVGALMALLEQRRKALGAEGLFDPERKQDIPFLPEVIGVVTSPTGAVIRDILHRLKDRFPRRVLLWPVLVQGDAAAGQIVAAIEGFNSLAPDGPVPRPDLLIVARGGGSLEDLWAFNEEAVVRAAAASDIPLISAVGHETDTTLIDHASDLRAPTPTAAAEMAVPVLSDLRYSLVDFERRLVGAETRLLDERKNSLQGLGRGLRDPRDIINMHQQRFDDLADRLPRALLAGVESRQQRLHALAAALRPRQLLDQVAGHDKDVQGLARRLYQAIDRRLSDAQKAVESRAELLTSLGYKSALKRGYAVVRGDDDRPISEAAAAKSGMAVSLEFQDGRAGAIIDGDKARGGKKAPAPQRRKKPSSDDQGSLL
jgi:exodeoxyribonuclease VII large subunit